MPILLSAASLAVYAWLNGGMTASVAFTSLAIFGKLEYSLSVMPNTVTELLDARISVKRIQQHLESLEKQSNTVPGATLAFEDAEIAWPSDNDDAKTTFRLHNISLNFPKGELSVVHGKTGSGKSLLLAALLGEADVKSGRIVVPKPVPFHDRHDDKANREDWILPSSIAFVAQVRLLGLSISSFIIFRQSQDMFQP